jgi:hypothetical protein
MGEWFLTYGTIFRDKQSKKNIHSGGMLVLKVQKESMDGKPIVVMVIMPPTPSFSTLIIDTNTINPPFYLPWSPFTT